MENKKVITTNRSIELETWIKENELKIMTIEEAIKLLSNFSEEERNYIFNAKKLPIEEIAEAIKWYDNYNFLQKPDELLFVNNLFRKYRVDKNTIIRRIQEVRRIMNAEKSKVKAKKRKK